LLGFIRIALPNHQIVESHPDNHHEDLRLDCPFAGLAQFMETIDLDEVDNTQHSNIPYLVILYKFLQQWKECNNGMIPRSFNEKQAFKECIQNGIRCNDDGVPLDEENFDEAIRNVNSTVIPYKIPIYVQEILDSPSCTSASPERGTFWLLARALREFVLNEGNGRLPLRGSIPDMISTSAMYIDLCRIYQSQANQDMENVKGHLNQILLSMGKSTNYISEEQVRLFCRNSAFLRVLKYHSIEEQLNKPDVSTLSAHLENSESDIIYYVLLRAAEQFYEMYHFYPGDGVEGLEADVVKLKSITGCLFQKWQLSISPIDDDHITEFCRYGGGEVHSVAAFVGGVAAQEVIKIITHQFVPLNNTWIYNAATSSTLTVTI
jgi:amyloid beta precursor protein binding protein 1